MIRLLHWISRNTNLALFKKVCNTILLMASFCVCYKRHTSLSERRFCGSYSLDICRQAVQRSNWIKAADKPRWAERQLQMITWANIPELQPQTRCAVWQRLWASGMGFEGVFFGFSPCILLLHGMDCCCLAMIFYNGSEWVIMKSVIFLMEQLQDLLYWYIMIYPCTSLLLFICALIIFSYDKMD